MTELALLAEELGVNERTLRRAVSQGTLRAAKPTARRLQISLAERRYIRRSWPVLMALRTALRTEHNVRFALLFGSAARGTATRSSDLDLLVVLKDPSLDQIIDLGTRLTAATGRRVDLARMEDAAADPLFLAEIVADGRVVVDRLRLWPQLSRSEGKLRRQGTEQEAEQARLALAGIDRLLNA